MPPALVHDRKPVCALIGQLIYHGFSDLERPSVWPEWRKLCDHRVPGIPRETGHCRVQPHHSHHSHHCWIVGQQEVTAQKPAGRVNFLPVLPKLKRKAPRRSYESYILKHPMPPSKVTIDSRVRGSFQ